MTTLELLKLTLDPSYPSPNLIVFKCSHNNYEAKLAFYFEPSLIKRYGKIAILVYDSDGWSIHFRRHLENKL